MHNAALNSLDVCLHNTHTSICKEKYGIKYCIVPRLPLRSRVRPLMSRCKRCDSMKVQLTFASTGVAIDTHTHTHTHRHTHTPPHTCVLEVEARRGDTDVGLEGQEQVVGGAVEQLWDGGTCNRTVVFKDGVLSRCYFLTFAVSTMLFYE